MPSFQFSGQNTPPDIQQNDLTGLNISTGLTVGFWYKEPIIGSASGLFADLMRHIDRTKIFGSANNGWFIANNGSRLQFSPCNATLPNSVTFTETMRSLSSNRWAHYAVTFDNTSRVATCYVNGERVSQLTAGGSITSVATTWTSFGTGGEYLGWSKGALFDVQLAPNAIFAPTDIRVLMDPRSRHDPRVLARWCGLQFNTPGLGGTVFDETGNGYNLTATATGAAPVQQGEEPPYLPTLA